MNENMLSSLSIFFPAYNEEANIAEAVGKAIKVASSLTDDFEVIVVNDGSADRTAVVVKELSQHDRRVKLIDHRTNQGYGAAVWTGIKSSTKEYVFFTDADLQFDISELAKFTEKIDQADVVIGYRAPRRDPLMRRLNGWAWTKLIGLLFGAHFRDVDCAFKLFRADTLSKIDVKSRGAMFSAELLIRLKISGARIVELPVGHYPRKAGSPTGASPKVILRAFRELKNNYRELRHLVSSKP